MRIQAIILMCLLASICSAPAEDDKRPNIVLVVAKELARERLGCYGGKNSSPNIDRLAKQGVRYATAWGMLDSKLSRRTVLTGRYPWHDAETPLFPSLLEKAGYRVATGGDDTAKSLAFIEQSKKGAPFLLLHIVDTEDADADRLVGKLVTAIDAKGLKDNTMIVVTSDHGNGDSKADTGAHVPFIVRAPFLTKGDRVSKDLVDLSDLFPTVLSLAGIDVPKDLKLDGRTMIPSLRGSDDPFEKRNWIYSEVGDFRMVRDWHHLVDTEGNFHDVEHDPHQEKKVSPLDKQAPARRQRLQMILDRFPR